MSHLLDYLGAIYLLGYFAFFLYSFFDKDDSNYRGYAHPAALRAMLWPLFIPSLVNSVMDFFRHDGHERPRNTPLVNLETSKSVPQCPSCNLPMKLRKRKSDGAKFWGCHFYPRCKGTKEHIDES